MTYDSVASITQIAALILFVALFAGVLIYAFWPGNKKAFEDAANIPLEPDPDQETGDREQDG